MVELTKQKILDDSFNISLVMHSLFILLITFSPSFIIMILTKDIIIFTLIYLFFGVLFGGIFGIVPLIIIIKRFINIQQGFYTIVKYTVTKTIDVSGQGLDDVPKIATFVNLISEDDLKEYNDSFSKKIFEGDVLYYVYIKNEKHHILSYNIKGQSIC